jgi:hypothetical protein
MKTHVDGTVVRTQISPFLENLMVDRDEDVRYYARKED